MNDYLSITCPKINPFNVNTLSVPSTMSDIHNYACCLLRVFVDEHIHDSTGNLTLTDAFYGYISLCEHHAVRAIDSQYFRALMNIEVNRRFYCKLRSDIPGNNRKCLRGWKGISSDIIPLNADRFIINKRLISFPDIPNNWN